VELVGKMTAVHKCVGYFPVNVQAKRQALERKSLFSVKKSTMTFSSKPLLYGLAHSTTGCLGGPPLSKWLLYISIFYDVRKLILNQENTFSV